MVKLQDLGVQQIDALRKQMDDQKLQDEKFAGMDERELMIQQLNALEVIAGTIETPGKALEASLIKNLPFANLNEIMAGAAVSLDTETVQNLTDSLAKGVSGGLAQVLMGSEQEQQNLEQYFGQQSTFEEMVAKGLIYFNEGISIFEGHFQVNDYGTILFLLWI